MISRLNRLRNFGIFREFSGIAASGLPTDLMSGCIAVAVSDEPYLEVAE